MFTENIDTLINNGVETIDGKILILKGSAQLYGPGLIMRDNSTQIN